MSKPVHPATVHFPIAFLFLSYGLDLAGAGRDYIPKALSSHLTTNSELHRASYFLLSLGLLSMIPSIVSGGQQAIMVFQKQGLFEADGKTVKVKSKAIIAHAVVFDIVLALNAYVWYSKRAAAQDTIAGKLGVGSVGTSEATYTPANWMVIAEAIALGLVAFGSNIGGALTYNYGVGLSAAKGSGVKKVQ